MAECFARSLVLSPVRLQLHDEGFFAVDIIEHVRPDGALAHEAVTSKGARAQQLSERMLGQLCGGMTPE